VYPFQSLLLLLLLILSATFDLHNLLATASLIVSSSSSSFFIMGKKKEEKQTAYVYIMDPDFAWRPAVLEETKGDKAIVSVPTYKVNTTLMR
jgi:hypothetical protein